MGCVANIGIKPPSMQTVKCVRADMARSMGSISKPAARLPAYRGRKVFTAWTSDERLSTFVATAEDRAPLRDDFKQLALLHQHDESLSEDGISQPKVLVAFHSRACIASLSGGPVNLVNSAAHRPQATQL